MKLESGHVVSWMNIGDEATGAHLQASVHDYPKVAQINVKEATQAVNGCFEKNGIPQKIKIDNGYPFVNPRHSDVPTQAVLWWIGLGINVIRNTPRQPQENGIVEGLQGTLCQWSNPKGQSDKEALQARLDEESDFQRNHYRLPSKGNKTRLELNPELAANERAYDPDSFEIQRVYDYLSEQVWDRTVRKDGEVRMFGHYHYIGKKFKNEPITVTFDPIETQWLFRRLDGTFLKSSLKGIPTKKEIKDFATMSKNYNTT